LLLIHGTSDSLVPFSQAEELARAAGSTCLTRLLPGVEHVKAYQSDPEGYVQVVGTFFSDHLMP